MKRTTFTTGNTRTQRLMVRGGLVVAGVLAVGGLAGLAERASANDAAGGAGVLATGEVRAVWDSLEAARGALTVAELERDRAQAVIEIRCQENDHGHVEQIDAVRNSSNPRDRSQRQ